MNINMNTLFIAQVRFEGEPDSIGLFQAAGLVGIAKFSVNFCKRQCSEVTVANTTYACGCGTYPITLYLSSV